jgi:hypothetical protein
VVETLNDIAGPGRKVAGVDKDPPDRLIDWLSGWKTSFDRLRNQVGVPLAVLVLVLCACGLVWWSWEEISKKPGVLNLVSWLSEPPIPKVQPGHLTIGLTHLEDDKENAFEKLIEDTIYSGNYADLMKIDRTVNAHSSPNERESHEHAIAEAKNILLKSGCDIVLWGTVIGINEKSAVRLNWTMANNINLPKESERYEINSVSLPTLFDDDLKKTSSNRFYNRDKSRPPNQGHVTLRALGRATQSPAISV